MKIIPFEDRIPEIQRELEKRRKKWTLSTLEYDDVCQIILAHIFKKYNQFNPEKGLFIHWINRIISCQIKNLLRNNLTIHSRPCILGCIYNLGGDHCSYTKSGIQCKECPLYAKWQVKKESHFFVKQTLPLENHAQEVNNMPNDSYDTDHAKSLIDQKLKKILKPYEWAIYECLYISNLTPEETGKKLKLKKMNSNGVAGYQLQLQVKQKVIKLAKEIIQEDLL